MILIFIVAVIIGCSVGIGCGYILTELFINKR